MFSMKPLKLLPPFQVRARVNQEKKVLRLSGVQPALALRGLR
jgi:hypothetical protein